MTKKNLGTKEDGWASKEGKSFGIEHGCRNGCHYCYARLLKDRRKLIKWEDWETPIPRKTKELIKKLKGGRYMFPSTHDIHPENQVAFLKTCLEILEKGNDLLIVSKPTFESIEYLANKLTGYQDKIEFRFSIGSMDDKITQRWESNASLFNERIDCLKLVFLMGYKTSISIEPYLDANPEFIIQTCNSFVTEDFWIGKMNHLKELNKKVPIIRELGWLYVPNRMLQIKTKLDKIESASIRYKNKAEWDELKDD